MRPDAIGALAAYVEREAVSSARIHELNAAAHAVRCRAGDGSEWWVATDQYGTRFGWADDLPGAMRQAGTLAPREPATQRTGGYER